MKDQDDILTKSQKKLLIDQEQWMKDVHTNYNDERTRMDAIYDIKQRFPTEHNARKILDEYGGDPVVIELYKKGLIKKTYRTKKNVKPARKCKCK